MFSRFVINQFIADSRLRREIEAHAFAATKKRRNLRFYLHVFTLSIKSFKTKMKLEKINKFHLKISLADFVIHFASELLKLVLH